MAFMKRVRLDDELISQGICADRADALRTLMAGLVSSGGERLTSPGLKVTPGLPLHVKGRIPYVGRGGLKLEGALDAFGINPTGLACLDVGCSTGGFTDCLLQHGAAQVTGLDVGQGQLHPRLRADARVSAHEQLNARDAAAVAAALDGQDGFDLLAGDLSFISQTLVLPAVLPWLKPGGRVLMLVKPQFELQPAQIGKGVIVRDPAHYAEVEHRLRQCCAGLQLEVLHWLDSPIAGGDGNREFFLHGRKAGS